MPQYKCAKHELHWEISDLLNPHAHKDENHPAQCPWCLQEENKILRDKLMETKLQRDVLLKAIDVAKLIQIIEGK